MNSWVSPKAEGNILFSKPALLKSSGSTTENGKDNAIQEKLSSLALLYDVPFAYLVPSKTMLQENEIRFFWLDRNWVMSLLDGAYSLGRSASIDHSCDTEFLSEIFNSAITNSVNVRRKLQKKDPVEGLSIDNVCTGFIMRSQLVDHWRGLEFLATNSSGHEIAPLRIETVGTGLLLGLFADQIQQLTIKEPPEGFHYGFSRSADGSLEKTLRDLASGVLNEKKISLNANVNRVVKFKEIAGLLNTTLDLKNSVNSAHIGLEMIQNPYQLTITINPGGYHA